MILVVVVVFIKVLLKMADNIVSILRTISMVYFNDAIKCLVREISTNVASRQQMVVVVVFIIVLLKMADNIVSILRTISMVYFNDAIKCLVREISTNVALRQQIK